MLRVPVASVVVVNCAVHVLPRPAHVSAVPRLPAPSLNCSVPSGVTAPSAVTVAVKVIDSPCDAGFNDETSTVAVLNLSPGVVTVSVSTSLKFVPETVP